MAAMEIGIEVFLIDGGPTDRTATIARKYADRLRLQVFERHNLSSWQAKVNFGVDAAKSTHVCFLGIDDVWLPGRASAVRHWIEMAPQTAVHLAPTMVIDKMGKPAGTWRCPLPPGKPLDPDFVINRLLVQNFIGAPSPVFRKDAWQRCGGIDESLWYTADWDFWLKLTAFGPSYYHDTVTTAFRIHGDSLTASGSRDVSDFEQQMRVVLERHLNHHDRSTTVVERAARVSIRVNVLLAVASRGKFLALGKALFSILGLGIPGACRYLRYSRLVERVLPRLRAKWRGTF